LLFSVNSKSYIQASFFILLFHVNNKSYIYGQQNIFIATHYSTRQ
jgi:hypothetical protein